MDDTATGAIMSAKIQPKHRECETPLYYSLNTPGDDDTERPARRALATMSIGKYATALTPDTVKDFS